MEGTEVETAPADSASAVESDATEATPAPDAGGEATEADAGGAIDAADTAESEPVAAETPPDALPEAAAAPVLSTALVAQAACAGLDIADISECASDAELQRMVRAVERRAPKEDSGGKKPADEPQLEEIPELTDPELYGEPLTQWGKSVRDHVLALRSAVAEMRQAHQERESAAYVEWFDGQLGGLEHGAELFGSGPGTDLQAGSKPLANREKLWNALATIRRGHAGRAEPPRAALLKQAYQMAFGGDLARIKQDKLGQHLVQRRGQFTLPPSQRTAGTSLGGESAAIAKVDKFLAEKAKR